MNTGLLKKLATLSLIFQLLGLSMMAQSRSDGVIEGTVHDDAGAAIVNAEVRLLNAQQASLGVSRSDVAGKFRFENVSNGSYIVRASRSDFSTKTISVKVETGANPFVDIILSVNQLSEQVTVTANTGLAEEKERYPSR